MLEKLTVRDGKRELNLHRSQHSRKALHEAGTRNTNDNIKNRNDGDDATPPPPFMEHSISQDKPDYAAVANKPTISVAKLYCLLMLPFLAG